MIDPSDVTKFDRTQAELEECLLFAIFVASKKATVQAQKLEQFLGGCTIHGEAPFSFIRTRSWSSGGFWIPTNSRSPKQVSTHGSEIRFSS